MAKALDLTNKRFGRLIAIKFAYSKKDSNGVPARYWVCKCDCGNTLITRVASLRSGKTKSCGCRNRTKPSNNITHHKSETRLYYIYKGIKSRCFNPHNDKYMYYGGKGITVCDEWLGKNGAINFLKWAEQNGYKEGLTIDRINVNGNYEPSNCRWITHQEQMFNRSNSIVIEGINIAEYVTKTGIVPVKTAYQRYKSGWDVWDIITIPPIKGGQKLEAWKKAHPEHEEDIARARLELARV